MPKRPEPLPEHNAEPAGEAPGRKALLLRLDPAVWSELRSWADDDFRSLNAHIEFVLRDALRRAGRWPKGP